MTETGGLIPILEGAAAGRWVAELRDRVADAAADVGEILQRVRRDGDAALLDLTERFDGVRPPTLRVPAERCRAALEALPEPRRTALGRACDNVEAFHAAQRREEPAVEVERGVRAWREFRPLERVGLYVPGGRAAYPSSLVMTAVPARVAGCGELIVCSPPGPSGEPATSILAAAALLEVDALYAVGGAQAIAAMAYGTESIPSVDKIFGPGSRWVDAAKSAVASRVATDLPAGPSEVLVWADASAEAELAALELIAQAEHGPDSLCVAIVPGRALARAVVGELEERIADVERREDVRSSLARSAVLVADSDEESVAWVNAVAPEHLVVLRDDQEASLAAVRHAGSVFLGPQTPVAAGDYATGTNHVLPTGARARGVGGLSLDDFGKWLQVQRLDLGGLRSLGPTIVALAEWEGLPAHAASVTERLGGPDGRG